MGPPRIAPRRTEQGRPRKLGLLCSLLALTALEASWHLDSLVHRSAFGDVGAGVRQSKPRRPPRRSVADVQVGEELEGDVKAWLGMNGYIVDVRCKFMAHVEACEISDGFPTQWLEKGQRITARVLDVSAAEKRFHLTLRPGDLERPKRKPLLKKTTEEDVQRFVKAVGDRTVEGEVYQFAFYGVFVRMKQPDLNGEIDGLVHKKSFTDDFAKSVTRGQKVKVRVTGSEGKKIMLRLADE